MLQLPYALDYALAVAMTQATVAAASSGNNTLVAAPGEGYQLAVAYLKGEHAWEGNRLRVAERFTWPIQQLGDSDDHGMTRR